MASISATPRRSWIRWEVIALALPALLLVLVLFIFPFLFGFDLSLHTDPLGQGPRSLDNYTNFFNDQSQIDTIWMTFQVALPATVLNVIVSLPLAYYMRRGIRFER